MEWKMPPRKGRYKLVATVKLPDDIGLIVLCPETKHYYWSDVKRMPDCEIKDYFMSMREDIEAGAFDDRLLDKHLLNPEAPALDKEGEDL
ncbi:hypothetical protein SAMN05216238_10566 [Lentibacillus persicus]|uniref:Uncharacterized protein n=1 Tax=Lentibacillus persicus TaxID=640948 RepID=A0A1I1VZ36_9BACI|nr:hypothetical protein [Lentibacillus persicus]SFD87348.1 hypothetical protein SAMN05216238_10566 [Lentibacillus persicus]